MDKIFMDIGIFLFEFICVVLTAAIIFYVGKFIFNKFKSTSFFKSSRFFNPKEYIPEEELSTLNQVFYLAMIIVFVVNILYLFFEIHYISVNLKIFDIIVSFYIAVQMDKDSLKDKFILFLLIPFNSISFLLFGSNIVTFFHLLHSLVFLKFIKDYFYKFLEYSETNSLGITIFLLFAIVFISFLFTIIVEDVTPIDSMNMVSNAFTSNGYTVLGHSAVGKLNAIALVWSGFILSGVGTATLTVGIVKRHIDNEFDQLENLIKRKKKN